MLEVKPTSPCGRGAVTATKPSPALLRKYSPGGCILIGAQWAWLASLCQSYDRHPVCDEFLAAASRL